jgi:hypothetical protein
MTTDQTLPDIPSELFGAIKTVVLRCVIAAPTEDDAALGMEIAGIITAGPEVATATIGYLLGQFVNALERGVYGGKDLAIDEIERELARVNPGRIGSVDHGR